MGKDVEGVLEQLAIGKDVEGVFGKLAMLPSAGQ